MSRLKAAFLQNYGFALRMTCAVALAWWLAFRFQLDRPAWSIMTVAIVAIPNQGALVAKFIARLIGTFLGAAVVNVLANFALSDPWLFAFYLAVWISCCAYMASCHRDMATYCFALSGYTSAIIGFSLASSPSPSTVFYITQARISEIVLGLLCAGLFAFVFPSGNGRRIARRNFEGALEQLSKLFSEMLGPETTDGKMHEIYAVAMSRLTAWKADVLYDNLSPATRGTERDLYLARYGRIVEIMNACMNLHAVKTEMLRDAKIAEALKKRLLNFHDPDGKENNEGEVGRLFQEIRDTQDQLTKLQNSVVDTERQDIPRVSFRDKKEALRNALRAFVCIIVAVAFWISGNWSHGHMFLIMTCVALTLGATYPNIYVMIPLFYFLTLLVIPVCYLLIYGVMVGLTSLVPAMLIVLPVFFVIFFLKTFSKVSFVFWHCFSISLVFLVNFANPPSFDQSEFLNIALAIVASMVFITLAFNLIRPSSDATKIARYKKMIVHRFLNEITRIPYEGKREFSVYVDNALYVASSSLDRWPGKAFPEFCRISLLVMEVLCNINPPQEANVRLFEKKFWDDLMKNNFDDCLRELESIKKSSPASNEKWELTKLAYVLKHIKKAT